jgi:hypothetical protein
MKKLSAILTTAILLLSTIPAVVPHGLILDQGKNTAALIGDIFANTDEEIFVQYLGKQNARIHYAYFDDECVEDDNFAIEVTPLDIVKLEVPDQVDRKLLVVVEDTLGQNLLDEPLIGIVYYNGRTAIKNLPAVTAHTNQQPNIIRAITPQPPFVFFNADGEDYDLLPLNFISLPFLTDGEQSPDVFNSLAVNNFNGEGDDESITDFDDEEDPASDTLLDIDCAGLTNIAVPTLEFADIGGTLIGPIGIDQGVPPGAGTTGAGVGAIRSNRFNKNGILVESTLSNVEENGAPDVISNVFYFGNGNPVSLVFGALPPVSQSAPQGIFTGDNENYQNPRPTGALASIGIQQAIEEEGQDTDVNLETIWAIYNNENEPAPDRVVKARFDFIVLDPAAFNECNHIDFSLTLTPNDVEYVRISDLTGGQLDPQDPPVIGVLTVWDPENGETLAGFRWDALIRISDGQVVEEVTTQEAMLSLDATVNGNLATFEAAKQFTTITPTIDIFDPDDFNIAVVNWDALDDPSALDQVLDFQVTDDQENVRSIKIPTTECITLLDKQSFSGLSDGTAFGTSPDSISYTGQFNQPNRGLAAFMWYNPLGIFPTQELTEVEDLALTNTHHDGEVFTDINIMPGGIPGDEGTFKVEVGVTPSVTQAGVDVTARWFAAVDSGNKKIRGPLICEEEVTHNLVAGEAFAIIVDDCPVDPLSIDAFLEVESSPLAAMGRVSIFVPATT